MNAKSLALLASLVSCLLLSSLTSQRAPAQLDNQTSLELRGGDWCTKAEVDISCDECFVLEEPIGVWYSWKCTPDSARFKCSPCNSLCRECRLGGDPIDCVGDTTIYTSANCAEGTADHEIVDFCARKKHLATEGVTSGDCPLNCPGPPGSGD